MTAKQVLRKNMRELLATILPSQAQEESLFITKTIASSDYFTNCTHFCVYLPAKMHMTTSKLVGAEVDTIPILKTAMQQSKKCFVPHLPAGVKNAVMNMIQVQANEDVDNFPVDKWGIPFAPNAEQRTDMIADIQNCASSKVLILIPGLAFDKENHRLGRGMGHYDRFLKRVEEACKISNSSLQLVGVCFAAQVLPQIPTEAHDVTMDQIVAAKI